MLRILLFLATNVAVMVVLTIVVKVLGLEQALAAQGSGIYLPALLAMACIMGMGGSIISLLISKWSAKRMMGLHVIERPADTREAWLLDTVARLARDAGIGMPEVAILRSARHQCVCHRHEPEQCAGRGQHRAAQQHDAGRGRSGAGPRDHPRRQRRHGDARADSGRGEYLRHFPVAHHRQYRRPRRFQDRARQRARRSGSRRSSPNWCWASSPASS